jgi:hypothetical protein
MGFFRVLFGIWAGWLAVRVLRHFVGAQLGRKTQDQQIHPDNKKTLELVACPYCGVFTTTPCTNPDCPGRGI